MTLRFARQAINLAQLEIETARLRLRPVSREYTRDIFENFTPAIAKYMMPRPALDISETEAFIDRAWRAYEEGTDVHSVVCRKDSGEFLGICGLHARDSDTEPELGIWLKREAHGHHYGLEAIDALVRWASENLVCSRFIYPVDRQNAASRAIAESLNGIVIRELTVQNMSGHTLDEVVYGIPPKSSTGG